jgi:hypothetical protein
MRHSWLSRAGVPLALVALSIAACGGTGAPQVVQSNSASTAPGQTTTTADPAASTTAVDTTVADTSTTVLDTTTSTTVVVTTTAPPLTPADLVLRSDGIGPLVFGAPVADTLGILTPALGPTIIDESANYPNEPTPGQFESVEGDYGFAHPYERQVCFNNSLCITFGGSAPDRLAFVGWELSAGNPPLLLTTTGITVGSRWADFAGSMTVEQGGCFTQGFGQTAGVNLYLESTGELFGGYDEAGNYVVGNPDPADVTVTFLSAGNLRIFLYGDC